MVTILDTRAAPPSGEGPPAGHAGAAQAGLDPRARRRRHRRRTARRAQIVREHGLHTVCEEAGCPNIGECWAQAPRHHDDHGRHLHARLRLLQRAHRACRSRSMPHEPRARGARRSPSSGSSTSSSPRSTATISPTAAAAHFAATIRAIRAAAPADHHRGADAGFPAQGRRARDGGRGHARRLQPQPRDGAARSTSSIRPGARYFHSLRLLAAREGARPDHVHQVRASWWASARRARRCCR